MKRGFLIAVLLSAASWAAAGRDLTEHVRFLADLDSPVQMGGELYPDPTKEKARGSELIDTAALIQQRDF